MLKFETLKLNENLICSKLKAIDVFEALNNPELRTKYKDVEMVLNLSDYTIRIFEPVAIDIDEDGRPLDKPKIVKRECYIDISEWFNRKYNNTIEVLFDINCFGSFDTEYYEDIEDKTTSEFIEILKEFFKDVYKVAKNDKKEIIEELAHKVIKQIINLCEKYEKELEKELEF